MKQHIYYIINSGADKRAQQPKGGGVNGGMPVTLLMGLLMLALAVNIRRQVGAAPAAAA